MTRYATDDEGIERDTGLQKALHFVVKSGKATVCKTLHDGLS